MKLLKILSMVMALMFITSCGHFGKKGCCPSEHSKACMDGKCAKDMSCCKNKDGKCKGNPEDCKGKQCKLKKKDCKSGSCDMKKKKACCDKHKMHDCKKSAQCKDGKCILKRDKKA